MSAALWGSRLLLTGTRKRCGHISLCGCGLRSSGSVRSFPIRPPSGIHFRQKRAFVSLHFHLGFPQQELQVPAAQDAVVLHVAGQVHVAGAVHGAVNLHVAVDDVQVLLFVLEQAERKRPLDFHSKSHKKGLKLEHQRQFLSSTWSSEVRKTSKLQPLCFYDLWQTRSSEKNRIHSWRYCFIKISTNLNVTVSKAFFFTEFYLQLW